MLSVLPDGRLPSTGPTPGSQPHEWAIKATKSQPVGGQDPPNGGPVGSGERGYGRIVGPESALPTLPGPMPRPSLLRAWVTARLPVLAVCAVLARGWVQDGAVAALTDWGPSWA